MSAPFTGLVRAPGKAMLFGEYAVLDGAPALVAAVDRYATATCVEGEAAASESPFIREARAAREREVIRRGGVPGPTRLRVDSSPLYASGTRGRKLGLGSSAAVTVAAVGDLPDLSRSALWRICQTAHARAQGTRGSGADIAAAIWGGVIRFQLAPSGDECVVTPVALAPDLAITLVDTGVAAATAPRLARLAALSQYEPARYASVMAPLRDLASAVGEEAAARGSIDRRAVRAWNDALDGLAAAIVLPIVTDAHRAIAACAESCGGCAKPSGAGGGDLAVCFTPREATAGLRARLLDLGFEPLALTVGARGLHSEYDPNGVHSGASVRTIARSDLDPKASP